MPITRNARLLTAALIILGLAAAASAFDLGAIPANLSGDPIRKVDAPITDTTGPAKVRPAMLVRHGGYHQYMR
ncbi:MAG: hypothetical protein LUC93_07905 [Planctomycetaceae bacterium]|nr:hypothetical protein [Planctomycetaceae bacterium]